MFAVILWPLVFQTQVQNSDIVANDVTIIVVVKSEAYHIVVTVRLDFCISLSSCASTTPQFSCFLKRCVVKYLS